LLPPEREATDSGLVDLDELDLNKGADLERLHHSLQCIDDLLSVLLLINNKESNRPLTCEIMGNNLAVPLPVSYVTFHFLFTQALKASQSQPLSLEWQQQLLRD